MVNLKPRKTAINVTIGVDLLNELEYYTKTRGTNRSETYEFLLRLGIEKLKDDAARGVPDGG